MSDMFKDMEHLEKQYKLSLSRVPSLALSRVKRATPSVYAVATQSQSLAAVTGVADLLDSCVLVPSLAGGVLNTA